MTRQVLLTLVLNVVLASSLFATHGQAAVPLAVSLSSLRMVAPGRVGFDVVITGLRPELQPTIEGSANLGGQPITGPPGPTVAARIPASIDLLAGRVRVGGDASVAEFPPVPPLTDNTPIALEVTVPIGHQSLMEAAITKIADVLMDNGAGGSTRSQGRAKGTRRLSGFSEGNNPVFLGAGMDAWR